jgi:signal transduction histidine kinase
MKWVSGREISASLGRVLKGVYPRPRDGTKTSTLKSVHDFNRSLLLIVDPESLQASIAARLTELFGPDRIMIWQLDPERGGFFLSFTSGFENQDWGKMMLPKGGHLARWLLINETCLVIPRSPGVFVYLSAAEQEMLNGLNIRVCVPLISLNRLTGIIMLGSKLPGWELKPRDTELLLLLAGQAALAFDNSHLYYEQRDRLRRIYRAERLAAAGELAAGIAHEIRNPLTAIRSTIQYVLRDYQNESPKRSLLLELLTEVDRIDHTVGGLLGLARPGKFDPKPVDALEILDQSVVLVNAQAQSHAVEVHRHYTCRGARVMGDPGELKQVFLNVLLNALQAMPRGGSIMCSIEDWSSRLSAVAGRWLEIRIRDSGVGIAPEHLDKIFDPFFTTKRDGTGLGLSVCHGIIQRHEGEIDVQSELGKGTTVSIRLPVI